MRVRLLLAYVGLILVGFTALVLLAGSQISSGTLQDFTGGLEDQAQLVARALKEPVEHFFEGESSEAAIQTVLRSFANETEVEVVVLDGRGRILASSTGSHDVSFGPELEAALRGSRSTSTRGATAYAAAPILEDGRTIGVVQIAAPLSVTQSLIRQRWLTLGGAVLGLLLLAGLAAYLLANTLTRPLDELRQASLQIAQGDFSQHVNENQLDEFEAVARAFNQMTSQVEDMLEEQRSFASNASHELRTPLTTIRLRSEALRRGTVDGDLAQQYIVEIDDEAARLGDMVQDLMLLSRLDAGRLQPGQEAVDSIRLARQIMNEVAEDAEAHKITLVLEAPESVPLIRAGQNHVAIVFRNLLTNALKYTPDGGRIVWRMATDNDAILHTIHDNGLGIAPDDLPHLFERFYRGDKSRSRQLPGVGLGLPLSKLIVEFYGGTIWLESNGLQQGTIAHVRWPVVESVVS